MEKTQLHIKQKTLMQGQAYTSDRTCFTLSSTGTTEITAQGEGSSLLHQKGGKELTDEAVDGPRRPLKPAVLV